MEFQRNKETQDRIHSVANQAIQRKPNKTGLPDKLKSGIENLSGHSMDDVKVHYNSSRPAQLNAHAFAQGNQIHLASGQEKHLPHEAWHVVQQKQGRVKPTMQLKSSNANMGLGKDTDVIGMRANEGIGVVQRAIRINFKAANPNPNQLHQHVFPEFNAPLIQNVIDVFNRNNENFHDMKNFLYYIGLLAPKLRKLDAFAQARNGAGVNIDPIRQQHATLTIGASHTGDMYHLKAAKALFPNLNILIWGVNIYNIGQAFQIASYMNSNANTYYTSLPMPTGNGATSPNLRGARHGAPINWRSWINEGQCTTLIMAANSNSGDGGATEKGVVKVGTAPIPMGMTAVYGQILQAHHFAQNVPYILVNFRQSGHGAGTAPALDTGTTGFDDIITRVRQSVPTATIVPMGDRMPPGVFQANLVNYWNWPGVGDREHQAGLLRYLNENYNVVGAVGMRSGIMDSLAFAGIKIVSIDISPMKPDNTSKGWERGSKLEEAYGIDYGRVFIKHPRVGETSGVNPWAGSFHANDIATIGTAVNNYLGTGAIAIDRKDTSHPLSTHELQALINRVAGVVVPIPAAPLPAPAGGHLAAIERTRINKIKDLVAVNYTHIPNAVAYTAILNRFLTFPTP